MAENTGTILTIRELTGDQRMVELRGRGLPAKPMVWEGEHTINETKYAGSPTKSQQALGASELDSEWNGKWCTKFLARSLREDEGSAFAQVNTPVSETIDGIEGEVISNVGSRIGTARELAELVDDIRRKGQSCRVSWAHLSRVGKLSRFKQSWTTTEDVDWTMSWKWAGRDESTPMPTPGQADVSRLTNDISAAFVDVVDATAMDDIGLVPDIADIIDSQVGTLQRGVLELEDTVLNASAGVADQIDALKGTLTTITFIRDEADNLIEGLDHIITGALALPDLPSFYADASIDTPERMGTRIPGAHGLGIGSVVPVSNYDLTTISPGRAIAAACAHRRAVRAARALKHKAARQRFATLKQIDASAIAVVLARQDEDLHDLSLEFYGTSDEADRIRKFNALETNSPAVGTVIVIPIRKAV